MWERLPAMEVLVNRTDRGWRMTLMLECEGELQALRRHFPEAEVEQDEEMCYCRLSVTEGGVGT